MNDISNTIALGSLTASLVAALVWLLKHFASHTLPEIQAAQNAQIERLCALFKDDCDKNRSFAFALHKEMGAKVERLAEAVEQNQRSLIELLERTPANGQYPKMWKPPFSEHSLPGPLPRPGGDQPDDAA